MQGPLVGKAHKGSLAHSRPDDLAALTIKETLKRAGGYDGHIDDVIIGCATPEAEQGMNMARNIAGLAGLGTYVPGITINRYCSSGLQSIAYAAERIMIGASDTIIAGGAESMSMLPMGGHVIKPNQSLSRMLQDIIWEWAIRLKKWLIDLVFPVLIKMRSQYKAMNGQRKLSLKESL